jgi:hypothetical protein
MLNFKKNSDLDAEEMISKLKQSDLDTEEMISKLQYSKVSEEIIQNIVARVKAPYDVEKYAKMAIAQCAYQGFVSREDLLAIMEGAPGFIQQPALTRKNHAESGLTWCDLVSLINPIGAT